MKRFRSCGLGDLLNSGPNNDPNLVGIAYQSQLAAGERPIETLAMDHLTTVSARVAEMRESASIQIGDFARRLKDDGRHVISLAIGEPDFDTPRHIKVAAVDALLAGQTKYTNVDGTKALKGAIIAKLARENDLRYDESEIIVSNGAKQCIFNFFCAVLEANDEVIIPAPYWVSYPEMVRFAQGRPVFVSTGAEHAFKVTADMLAKALTSRSRILVLNSPNNPSGAVYSREELNALGEVISSHKRLLVLSDDIYEHIRWSEDPFANVGTVMPALRGRLVLVNGVSKAYAMTGWRIGYAAAARWLVDAMRKIQGQSTSNPNSVAQHAAAAALNGGINCVRQMVAEFRRRHDYVISELNTIEGIQCMPGEGTFYAFPDVRGLMRRKGLSSDVALAQGLLEEVGIATVPGEVFGCPGYLRLSFATSMYELRAAMDALKRFSD
jgi:aspartate aminotransferase